MKVLYIRTLGNIQGNVSSEGAVLKCIPNFFLEICRSFRTTAEEFGSENCVLAYHTVDKDHAKILQTVRPSFLVFFVSYINQNHKDTTHPS